MKRLIDEYNNLYPNYASTGVVEVSHTFDETNNSGKPDTLQHLTVNGMNGIVIPSVIVKDHTSLFSKAGSNEVLKEDCDGIFFTERNEQKYIYLCELKSSFSTQQISKAKNQIVGSYLKLHSLLSLLQSYNPDEWTVKGVIASFIPKDEQQAYLLKKKEEGNKVCGFCYNLNRDKRYHMPKMDCCKFYSPMKVPDLTLHYVSVPDNSASFAVDFNELL
ncbi:hypothetical protein [Parabacteroides goldsteinii]|uniref:hypothetical protein n=1 Tax=Parabacteroides goldsteinii TaxID=328812 RepID=UPI0032B16053